MSESTNPRLIKRYNNRKLYDTGESRYVTLEEIATLVKEGIELQILDNRSGKDLTGVTLAQILYEEQKKQTNRMPLGLLKDIIRNSGSSITDFVQRKLTQPVQNLKEGAERKVDEWKRLSETTVEEKSKQVREFFSNTQKMLDDIQKKMDERIQSVVGVVGSRANVREQLKNLRKKIEELESKFREH